MSSDITYKLGLGHDVADVDMDVIVPEPRVDMVGPVEREYSITGVHHEQGLCVVYHFDNLETPAQYQAVLNQFGLNSVDVAEITINAQNKRLYTRRFNGLSHLPEPNVDVRKQRFFYQNIEIYVTDLVEIA